MKLVIFNTTVIHFYGRWLQQHPSTGVNFKIVIVFCKNIYVVQNLFRHTNLQQKRGVRYQFCREKYFKSDLAMTLITKKSVLPINVDFKNCQFSLSFSCVSGHCRRLKSVIIKIGEAISLSHKIVLKPGYILTLLKNKKSSSEDANTLKSYYLLKSEQVPKKFASSQEIKFYFFS